MFEVDVEGGVFFEEAGECVPDVVVGSYPGVLELWAEALPVCHVFRGVGAECAVWGVASALEP